jgi:hypothetical protein
MTPVARAIVTGTAVSGSLDILSAFIFNGIKGASPGQVLRYVASGPFGDAMRQGGGTEAAIGLLVHYGLMAIMVAVFVLAFERSAAIRRSPLVSGIVYGFLIYLVMYWVVTPARFGMFPKLSLWGVGNALFSHLLCVGLSMGYVVNRAMTRRAA